jgi:uncharacterized membrane protein
LSHIHYVSAQSAPRCKTPAFIWGNIRCRNVTLLNPNVTRVRILLRFGLEASTLQRGMASMITSKKLSGLALATAAAMMFSTAPLTAANAADDGKVKCEGVNACKGTSSCATASNSCAGKNACKGHGFLMLSQSDCDAAKAKAKK